MVKGFLVDRNLISIFMSCFCVASLLFSQHARGGAIYNAGSGALTFRGAAELASCSVKVSAESSLPSIEAVSGGE